MKIELVSPDEIVVLFSGDRTWTDLDTIYYELINYPKNCVIVHGAAPGLDSLADFVAKELGLRTISCPAHWRHTPRCDVDCREMVGKAAGAIRNHWMLDTYHPVAVVAFHRDLSVSRGTREMVTYSLKRKTPVKHLTGSSVMYYSQITKGTLLQGSPTGFFLTVPS